jgi:hypothetical protein
LLLESNFAFTLEDKVWLGAIASTEAVHQRTVSRAGAEARRIFGARHTVSTTGSLSAAVEAERTEAAVHLAEVAVILLVFRAVQV